MLNGDATAAYRKIIADGRGAADSSGWKALKAAAEAWRPEGWTEHSVTLRHFYEGRIAEHLQAYAQSRFPLTAKRMPSTPFNWARLYAETGAAVYDYPPTRHLERDGKKLEAKPPKKKEAGGEVGPGARIKVRPGKEHDPAHRGRGAVVVEADGAMLGVRFDGEQETHRWYSTAEVEQAGGMAGAMPLSHDKAKAATSEADRKRAEDFATMIEEAGLDVVMAEAERRVVLGRTIFLSVFSDSIEAIAKGKPLEPVTKVEPFWPSDVLVIPHPSCPTSLATAVSVMLRIAGEDGVRASSTTYRHWFRTHTDDELGLPTFSKWKCEIVTERTEDMGRGQARINVDIKPVKWRGEGGAIAEEYPLPTLPIVAWHNGLPQGCPYLDADRNLVPLFDLVNSGLMSEAFTVEMNAARPMVRKTESVAQASTVALGPGMMGTIGVNDSIDTVDVGADFPGIRAANQALLGNLALTNRQSASDYDAQQTGAPSSGVALRIKNAPQDKARLEAIARAVKVERELLALMVEVHDHFRGTSIAEEGVTYTMTPAEVPDFEDPAARAQRLGDALDRDAISLAEYRVAMGHSRSIEDAEAAIEAIEKAKAGRPSPMRASLDRFGFGRPQREAQVPGSAIEEPERKTEPLPE